jgi:hypothetical protein
MTPALAALAYSRLPSDFWGWVIWSLVTLACAWVLWKCVQWTIWPGEGAPDHVKRSILDDDAHPMAPPSPPSGPPTPVVSSAARGSAAPEAPV